MAISGAETQPPPTIQSVKCDSCGFSEECTPAYILRVRERYMGRWICGLCAEAVKNEVQRSDAAISTEEALDRHISFCEKFRASSPPGETEHPIIAISRLLRRRLDSPGAHRSKSSSSLSSMAGTEASTLVRPGSCFSALSSISLLLIGLRR